MNVSVLLRKPAGLTGRLLAARCAECLLLSLLLLAALAAPARAPEATTIDVFKTVPDGATGLYDLEHFEGLEYRWTSGGLHLHFDHFALSRPYELRLLVSAGPRPRDAAAPNVTITANDRDILTFRAGPEWQLVSAILEPQGLNLNNDLDLMLSVPPFVPSAALPGSSDTRSLGVMLQQIDLHALDSAGSIVMLPPANSLLPWLVVSWLCLAITLDPRFGLSGRRRWSLLAAGLATLAAATWLAGGTAPAFGGWVGGALLLLWFPLREAAGIAAGARVGTPAWSSSARTHIGLTATASATIASTQRIPQLDGIRGVAILLVVAWHYVYNPFLGEGGSLGDVIRNALNLGWSGVDLFFVLSGFLIGGILLDHRSSRNYLKTFYIRRICRIFPLYFVFLLGFVGISVFLLANFPHSAFASVFVGTLPVWQYAVFLQNIGVALGRGQPPWLGVLWSLAVEEQFYLGFSLLVALLAPRKLPYVLLFLIVLAPVLRIGIIAASGLANTRECLQCYVLTPTRADSLLLGVLGAYALRLPRAVASLRANLKWLYLLLGGLMLGGLVLSYVAVTWPSEPNLISYVSVANTTVGFSWLGMMYLVFLLLALLDRDGVVGRLTGMWWLRQLGILAYGIYILHGPVAMVLYTILTDNFGAIPQPELNVVKAAALLATLGLAWLSWHYFEKKFVAWGHRFIYAETAREAAVSVQP